jgi:hypothetical protein
MKRTFGRVTGSAARSDAAVRSYPAVRSEAVATFRTAAQRDFMSDMVFARPLSYRWFTSRATLSQETVP